MFSYLSFFTTEVDSKSESGFRVKTLIFAEALFFLWAGVFAGLTFLIAMILGIIGVLSFEFVLYIYAAISVIALMLAVIVHLLRSKQDDRNSPR
ncbi:MAG: hypothetical protein KTR19_02615 [Hyphomicrobiales bacterium]|nr:hypothetical protein [Hyphomicrobiales bacterium]